MLSLHTVIIIYNLALVCHIFHSNKGIPYSQALRLNHICSKTNSFDKRYTDLERFLLERGYNSKLVQKEILWARKIARNKLLDKEKSLENDSKLTLMLHVTQCLDI